MKTIHLPGASHMTERSATPLRPRVAMRAARCALLTCSMLLAMTPAAFGQKWEFGAGAGGGFYTSETVTSPAGNADAKFAMGLAGSAWLVNNSGRLLSGELRYDFQQGDMKLTSGGASASFGAQSHAIHYDFVLNAMPAGSRIRPFVAAGGGVKIYRGTGTEVEFQPLGNIALLTKTHELKPLVSVGGGVKFRISNAISLRVEVHDYLTPFPQQVIAPALNAKVGGWLQDIVPMIGLSFVF
ncbi:MAG: outer membrane beta-barrel protein [Bryobacteraceae bacterium]